VPIFMDRMDEAESGVVMAVRLGIMVRRQAAQIVRRTRPPSSGPVVRRIYPTLSFRSILPPSRRSAAASTIRTRRNSSGHGIQRAAMSRFRALLSDQLAAN
jgi:hypothetical protein